jgi:hypothetical protein
MLQPIPRTIREQSERFREFDHMIEVTDQVFADPRVTTALGDYAKILFDIHSSAYLPNIRNGVISIPKQYRSTDSVAVVPLLEDDLSEGLRRGKTFTWPALSRSAFLTAELKARSPRMTRYGVAKKLKDYIVLAEEYGELSEITSEWNSIEASMPTGPEGLRIAGGFSGIEGTLEGLETAYTSRPLILLYPHMSELSRVSIAAKLIHEYVHVKNMNESRLPVTALSDAQDELEAYYVDNLIFEALADEASEDDTPDSFPGSMVEEARRRYTTHDAPFTPNDSLLKLMKKYGISRE